MNASNDHQNGTLPQLPSKPRNLWPIWLSLILAVVFLIIWDLEISFGSLLYGINDIAEYFSRYGSPDFSDLPKFLKLMGVTIAMALWGTVLAVLIAFLLAPLAAQNFTYAGICYRVSRETLNIMRAMPDLLLALIFVASLGLGPLPGVLALGVHSAGFLGKFFAESFERLDKSAYEGVLATGASTSQLLMYVGWPSILREAIGYTLYIFDRNVRMASVLGLVGAGGIGLALHETLRMFNYSESATLILVILTTILIVDHVSSWLRRLLH